jgi:hypothetical protein
MRKDVDVRSAAGVVSRKDGKPLRNTVFISRLDAPQECGVLQTIEY